MRTRKKTLHFVVSIALAVHLFGCGGPKGPTVHKVSGLITFEGKPVDEGTVMFLHVETQDSQQTRLDADGRYELRVREGQHKVAVEPIVVETAASASSPASSDYKKVSNIPGRYRSVDTSGFTAKVTAPGKFDFEMTPAKSK